MLLIFTCSTYFWLNFIVALHIYYFIDIISNSQQRKMAAMEFFLLLGQFYVGHQLDNADSWKYCLLKKLGSTSIISDAKNKISNLMPMVYGKNW